MLLRNSLLHAWTRMNHRERSGKCFVLQHKKKQTISLVCFRSKWCIACKYSSTLISLSSLEPRMRSCHQTCSQSVWSRARMQYVQSLNMPVAVSNNPLCLWESPYASFRFSHSCPSSATVCVRNCLQVHMHAQCIHLCVPRCIGVCCVVFAYMDLNMHEC